MNEIDRKYWLTQSVGLIKYWISECEYASKTRKNPEYYLKQIEEFNQILAEKLAKGK